MGQAEERQSEGQQSEKWQAEGRRLVSWHFLVRKMLAMVIVVVALVSTWGVACDLRLREASHPSCLIDHSRETCWKKLLLLNWLVLHRYRRAVGERYSRLVIVWIWS